jgi:UDP-glucose 4-epimerase
VPVVGIWFRQIESGEAPTITGDGKNQRDFVNVKDVARANLLSATLRNHKPTAFNIGTGTNYSLNELCSHTGREPKYIAPRLEPKYTLADISKAKRLLNWEPEINVIDWIKNNRPII